MAAPVSPAPAPIPTVKGWTHRIVGKVFTPLVLSNAFDLERAATGELASEDVRTLALSGVLADSGASHLCLPLDMIGRLGLRHVRDIEVDTAAGVRGSGLYRGVAVTVGDRTDIFSCIELPGGAEPLLGCQVMEALGVVPDVVNHRLVFLPDTGAQTYLTAYRA